MRITANIIVLILFLGGIIFLQIFLSKKESKLLGLILPAINVFFSVIAVLGRAFFGYESFSQVVMQILLILLMFNIPTFILLSIYFACREKQKKNKEIEKMNIQDLD